MTLPNGSQHEPSMHSRLHRNAQVKGTCSIVYLLPNSRYQIPHRCITSWESAFLQHSTSEFWRYRCLRHTNRPCSPPSLVALSKANLFVSAAFASVYDLRALETSMHPPYNSALFSAKACRIIEGRFVRFCSLRIGVWPNLLRWGSLHAMQRQSPTSSNRSRSTGLGELARKLQDTHRRGSFRTRRRGSLHGSSRTRIAGGARICIAGRACTEAPGLSALGRRHRRLLWGSVEKTASAVTGAQGSSWYNLTKGGLVRPYWV